MKGLTIIIAFLAVGTMALNDRETNTLPDYYNELMDKQVNMNGKEVNVGRLVELLHRIGFLSDTNKLTLNTKVNVNGKQIEANLPQILKLLEGISETASAWKKMGVLLDKNELTLNTKVNVNGHQVEASLAEILKLIEDLTSDLPKVTLGVNEAERVKVAEKLRRIAKMSW